MSNEKDMTVYSKLAKARVELQSRNLKKSGLNKFAGFKYYELADFVPTINSIFLELGLLSVFSLDGEMGILRIIDVDSYEEISFTTPTEVIEQKGMTAIQALGSKHTYLKRYLYLNALEIVEGDVIDSLDNSQETTFKKETVKKEVVKKSNIKMITKEQIEALEDLMSKERFNDMLKTLKLSKVEEMTESYASQLIPKLIKQQEKEEVKGINEVV